MIKVMNSLTHCCELAHWGLWVKCKPIAMTWFGCIGSMLFSLAKRVAIALESPCMNQFCKLYLLDAAHSLNTCFYSCRHVSLLARDQIGVQRRRYPENESWTWGHPTRVPFLMQWIWRPWIEKECSLEDFEQAQRWFGGTLRGDFFGVATPGRSTNWPAKYQCVIICGQYLNLWLIID